MRLFRALPPVAAALALSLLAGAPSASAGEIVLPEDFSAADQYVESVPTSGGPHAAAIDKIHKVDKGDSVPLPPGISGRLTGKTGSQLKQVATSSKLGAPHKRLHSAGDSSPSVPSAAVSAIDEGGSSTMWLLLGLLLVTGALAGTAGHRHYNNRKTATGG